LNRLIFIIFIDSWLFKYFCRLAMKLV